MGEICQTAREQSLEQLEGASWSRASREEAPADAAVREHLAHCDDCRAWIERARRHALALASLPRVCAPVELEERVRQGVAGGRVVERALASLKRVSAPHVLERLVFEEIERPEQARARRFAGDLPRVPAPATLANRVEARVERGEDPVRRQPRRLRRSLWIAAAAAAGVLAGLGAWLGDFPRSSNARPSRFLVVEHRSASSLSPAAQAFLGGLAPGVLATRPEAEGDS